MSNFSRYSVFLEVDSVRIIVWCLALIGLNLNLFLILFNIWESFNIKLTRQEHRHHMLSIVKNPSSWFLFNLIVSDFIVSIYLFILMISDIFYTNYYQEQYGLNTTFSLIRNEWANSLTCYIGLFLSKIGLFVAATMTFLMSIDRFILIVYPHSNKKFNMKRVKIATVMTWIIGCILMGGTVVFNAINARYRSPYLFDFYLNLCLGDFYSTLAHTLVGFSELLYFSAIYSTVITLYFIIIRKLRKSRLTFGSQLSSTYERRFQVMFSLIALTNITSFFFLSVAAGIDFIRTGTFTEYGLFRKIVTMLPLSNVAIDPILYIIFRFQEIRRQLSQNCCQRRLLHVAVSPSKVIEIKSNDTDNVMMTKITS